MEDYLIEVLIAGTHVRTQKISRAYSDEKKAMHAFKTARRYYNRYSKYSDSDHERIGKKYSSYEFVDRELGFYGWNGAYICGAPKIYKRVYQDITDTIE